MIRQRKAGDTLIGTRFVQDYTSLTEDYTSLTEGKLYVVREGRYSMLYVDGDNGKPQGVAPVPYDTSYFDFWSPEDDKPLTVGDLIKGQTLVALDPPYSMWFTPGEHYEVARAHIGARSSNHGYFYCGVLDKSRDFVVFPRDESFVIKGFELVE